MADIFQDAPPCRRMICDGYVARTEQDHIQHCVTARPGQAGHSHDDFLNHQEHTHDIITRAAETTGVCLTLASLEPPQGSPRASEQKYEQQDEPKSGELSNYDMWEQSRHAIDTTEQPRWEAKQKRKEIRLEGKRRREDRVKAIMNPPPATAERETDDDVFAIPAKAKPSRPRKLKLKAGDDGPSVKKKNKGTAASPMDLEIAGTGAADDTSTTTASIHKKRKRESASKIDAKSKRAKLSVPSTEQKETDDNARTQELTTELEATGQHRIPSAVDEADPSQRHKRTRRAPRKYDPEM